MRIRDLKREELSVWPPLPGSSFGCGGTFKGYGGRLKLEAMWNKGRPIDPQFVALGKFLFSYAYGNPGKMVMGVQATAPASYLFGLETLGS